MSESQRPAVVNRPGNHTTPVSKLPAARTATPACVPIDLNREISRISVQIQNQSQGLARVFEPRELRALRKATQATATEHAASLVELNAQMARDTAIQSIDLGRKQRLTQLVHSETSSSIELQKQAQEAGCRAMERTLVSERAHQSLIAGSRCSEDDKRMLSQVAKELAALRIHEIRREQIGPFETETRNEPV